MLDCFQEYAELCVGLLYVSHLTVSLRGQPAMPWPRGTTRPTFMALALNATLTILASPSNARKITKLIIVIITN